MRKKYNTPHRSRVVKTRMTDEEYAEFTGRLEQYDISQAEFIRQAIQRATIRSVITVSPVNDELLAALGRLAAAELAALKFEVLQKVGEAIGDTQTYQL